MDDTTSHVSRDALETRGENETQRFEWIDVSEGALLPIILFLVEDSVLPEAEANLRILEFFTTLILKAQKKSFTLLQASAEDLAWFRHYRQDEDGLRIVNPDTVIPAENSVLQEL